ncbi:MAG TPA: RidA family protein [Flavisolibacter sp.]|jgi:enamine deaminase RidA (YjgF/YER057c/UK114 family)|nr:RidA family protein [Flavisolibacter sp.]
MKLSMTFLNSIPLGLFLLTGCAKVLTPSPEQKLAQLQITLSAVPEAVGRYVDFTRVGNLVFLSGKGPRQPSGEYIKGKLGSDLTVEQGYAAARITAINQLAVLKIAIGDLKKIKRIVRVNGYVNSAATFYDHPKVVDGFSDLLIEVFGNAGKHARTSVGTTSLPMNMAVEVEMIIEVESSN